MNVFEGKTFQTNERAANLLETLEDTAEMSRIKEVFFVLEAIIKALLFWVVQSGELKTLSRV